MRIIVLRTYTNDMERIWTSLEERDDTRVHTIQYDEVLFSHIDIVRNVKTYKPDLIVYIGAIEQYHLKPVLSVERLKELREIAPMVHICGDAGDSAWAPFLEEYDSIFNVQVGIDGVKNSPLKEKGLVLLPPISHNNYFHNKRWEEREHLIGFLGEPKSVDEQIFYSYGTAHPEARWLKKGTTQEIMEFMGNCKMMFNYTRTLEQRNKVNPIVADIAMARCMLAETKNPVTDDWFKDGEDYYTFNDFKELSNLMNFVKGNDGKAKKAAELFNSKYDKHDEDFWPTIFSKVLDVVST